MYGEKAEYSASMTFISRKDESFNGKIIQNIGRLFKKGFGEIAEKYDCYIGAAYNPNSRRIRVVIHNLNQESAHFSIAFYCEDGEDPRTDSWSNPDPVTVAEFERVSGMYKAAAETLSFLKNSIGKAI